MADQPATNNTIPGSLAKGVAFAVQKYLQRAAVLQQEETILAKKVEKIATDVKQQQVKKFIDKLPI